jgi:acetyl esterase/lipase/lysophospholipase L1-like esterase
MYNELKNIEMKNVIISIVLSITFSVYAQSNMNIYSKGKIVTKVQLSSIDSVNIDKQQPIDVSLIATANRRAANYQVLKQKILNGDSIFVVYLGGSITEGAMCLPVKGTNMYNEAYDYTGNTNADTYSWRALTFKNLQATFPTGKFKMINAAVGATHSELATYRLADNILSKYTPDLMFVEFAVNDGAKGSLSLEADLSIYRTMSYIIKRIEAKNPQVALFIPVSSKRTLLQTAEPDAAMKCHLQFAGEMRIPFQNITKVFFADPLPEGVTKANVFDGPDDAGNNVHPSPKGHLAYATAVNSTISKLFNGDKLTFSGDVKPFYTDYPTNAQFVTASELPIKAGWEIQQSSEYNAYINHVLKNKNVITAITPESPYEYKFKGKSVMLWSRAIWPGVSQWQGELEVYIDDVLKVTYSDPTMMTAGKLAFQRCMPIAYDLDPNIEHTLKLIPRANNLGIMRIAFYGVCLDTKEDNLQLPAKQIVNNSSDQYVFYQDVAYLGNSRTEKGDFYLPIDSEDIANAKKKYPVILEIHGGGWNGGDKSNTVCTIFAKQMIKKGFAVFSINYKLNTIPTTDNPVPKVLVWPQNIADCKTALRFLRKYSNSLKINPNKIATNGESAGGHLSLLTAYSSKDNYLNSLGLYLDQSNDVSCAVDFYGPTNTNTWGTLSFIYSNQDANKDEILRISSPVSYVNSTTPATFMIHGDADPTVPISESQNLKSLLDAAGVSNTLITVPGATHAFPITPHTWNGNTSFVQQVTDFLNLQFNK